MTSRVLQKENTITKQHTQGKMFNNHYKIYTSFSVHHQILTVLEMIYMIKKMFLVEVACKHLHP